MFLPHGSVLEWGTQMFILYGSVLELLCVSVLFCFVFALGIVEGTCDRVAWSHESDVLEIECLCYVKLYRTRHMAVERLLYTVHTSTLNWAFRMLCAVI